MVWDPDADKITDVSWIEMGDDRWGKRVLDVRPVTLNMLSTSADPSCANNAISFGNDDGTSFIGEESPVGRTVEARLCFPVDRMLADGVLFAPQEMEQKWAIFYHHHQIICVRSWQRRVQLIARVAEYENYIEITGVQGTFMDEEEDPELTVRMLDYLLRSHVLNEVYPVPLPKRMDSDTQGAALWCMAMFGSRALIATADKFKRRNPETPLRSQSLLHIAVARGDIPAMEASLAAGIPVDLIAGDGLAPLHWALACRELDTMAFLLDRGASVDVRSENGATPLMLAVQGRSMEQVSFLLDWGSDASACDDRGFTALHRGAEMGCFDLVKLLLDRRAPWSPIAEGHTPRSLAEAREETEIMALLDEYK